jgi:cell division septum initiation protein DivIVA
MNDQQLLEAALEGLLAQKQRIEDQISQVQSRLTGRTPRAARTSTAAPAASASPASRKRTMSAAARKRIAEAQKKRWAEFRKKNPPKDGKE